MRLKKSTIKEILQKNEGYSTNTYYSEKNYRVENRYKIKDGKVIRRSRGKSSWADSHFDETTELDTEQTRRFIRNNLADLLGLGK